MENALTKHYAAELKSLLSGCQTEEVLAWVYGLLAVGGNNGKEIADSTDLKSKTNLSAPKAQLDYLIGLMLTTEFVSVDLVKAKRASEPLLFFYLESINCEYQKEYLSSVKPGIDFAAPHQNKDALLASLSAFDDYFNVSDLRYDFQLRERIPELFDQFDDFFNMQFGFTTKDILTLYQFCLDFDEGFDIRCASFRAKVEKSRDGATDKSEKAKVPANKATLAAMQNFLDETLAFSETDIERLFSKEKTRALLTAFAMKRAPSKKPLLYTDPNPYKSRPIVKLPSGKLFILQPFNLLHAAYQLFNETVSSDSKKNRRKTDALDASAERLLKDLFGDDATIYRHVCTQAKTDEHDLLILKGECIFVVETKGSKTRKPKYKPEQNKTVIEDHFNSESGIGYGYQQAIKLKKFLESSTTVTLYHEYSKPFSISAHGKIVLPLVITLENFGRLGINTSFLLQKEADQPYPWVCWFDDLELIIKINSHLKKTSEDFIRYIKFRIKHHPLLLAEDELEILEEFYANNLKLKDWDLLIIEPKTKSLIDKLVFEENGVPYDYPRKFP